LFYDKYVTIQCKQYKQHKICDCILWCLWALVPFLE